MFKKLQTKSYFIYFLNIFTFENFAQKIWYRSMYCYLFLSPTKNEDRNTFKWVTHMRLYSRKWEHKLSSESDDSVIYKSDIRLDCCSLIVQLCI